MTHRAVRNFRFIAAWACLTSAAFAGPKEPPMAVSRGDGGKLNYVGDGKGNKIPDFSYAGYDGGHQGIPFVQVKAVVGAPQADNTAAIQAAIDRVAAMPMQPNGFRGAVLIPKGRYPVSGQLVIRTTGVVLRGSSAGEGGTVLLATGLDRRPLIRIVGANDRKLAETEITVADAYVSVGAMSFKVSDNHGLKAGDSILIHRPSTKEWIEAIGMDDLGGGRHGPSWRVGSRDTIWDRSVVAVEGNTITLDAPLTCAIEAPFGGAKVSAYTWPGRVLRAGVESLACDSTFSAENPKDEQHAWFAVTIDNATNVWVRQMIARHFAASAVAVWETAKQVTVEDCKFLQPVSEIGGLRRNAFFVTGQQVLMQRLYSEDAIHDFAVGLSAAGPNAFVQCESVRSLGESGGVESWATGVLYDHVRIDGHKLSLRNRGYEGQGTGWGAANSVIWNSSASVIECWQPPTAQNYALGAWGEFSGNGYWYGGNDDVSPNCLFESQLQERIDNAAAGRCQILPQLGDASSNPSLETAANLIAMSTKPRMRMDEWIDQAASRTPISTDAGGVQPVEILPADNEPAAPSPTLKLQNGWLTVDGVILTGGRMGVPWWNSGLRPDDLAKATPAITRFVPGRFGTGLTDELPEVVAEMTAKNKVAVEQHYALWYERRRDDHERIRRMDGDVVGPFYELPFARTGKELAWDGLSKYDLTQYNPWYFSRISQFAKLAEPAKLVVINQQYFQHNILEAGAHYADFPWRPVNNVNNTGFPEPVPFAGDKRVFMAEQFYDVTHPVRRELHRAYIRHCLEALADRPNVIQQIGEEFTGPQAFAEFWIDTIAEWEKETGKHVLIGLSTTKDVQDVILANPARAAVVDVIDIRYWWYTSDDKLYAPEGGKNLAPRQWYRLLHPKGTSTASIAKAVHEYRSKYPDKAVIYSVEIADNPGWGTLVGGGSLPNMRGLDPALAKAITTTRPLDLPDAADQYTLASDSDLIISAGERAWFPKLPDGATYDVKTVDTKSMAVNSLGHVKSTDVANIKWSTKSSVLWLHRN